MFWRKGKDEPVWDKGTGLLMHYPTKVVEEPVSRRAPKKEPTGEWPILGDKLRRVETVEAFLRRMRKPGHRFKITLDDGLDYVASAYDERSGSFFLSRGGESFHITMEEILSRNPRLTADGGVFIPQASKPKVTKVGGRIGATTDEGLKDLPETLLSRRMLDCQKFHITLLDGSLHYIQFDKGVGKFLISPGPNDVPYHLSRGEILDNPVVETTYDGGIVLGISQRKVTWEPISGTTMSGYDAFFNSTGAIFIPDPMPAPISPPETDPVEEKLTAMRKCRCKSSVQIEGYGVGTMHYDGKSWVLTKQSGKVLTRVSNDGISKVCESLYGNMLYIKNW